MSKARKPIQTIAWALALLLSIPAIGPLTFCYEKFDPKGSSFIWVALDHAYKPLGPVISTSKSPAAKALRKYYNLWAKTRYL